MEKSSIDAIGLDIQARIDWFRVIVDLERKGWTPRRISDHPEVDIPRSTLVGWKLGNGRPKFEEGLRVILLWSEVCEKTAGDVPTYNPYAPAC